MLRSTHKQSPGAVSKPVSAGATGTGTRPSSSRLPVLVIVGILLVGAALFVRSNRPLHEYILRGKDVAELEAIVRNHPDDTSAHYYLAKRYFLAHRLTDARNAYDALLRREPDSARAHLGLALTYYEQGAAEPARVEFEQTLRLDKRSAWAEYMLGKLAWDKDNLQEAVTHVKRSTEYDPRGDPAWYALGVCNIQLHRYDEAIEALNQALARRDASPRYHTALGEVLVFRDHPDEGRRHYERALQLNPDYGPACALMGQFYLRKGSGLGALDHAEELLLRATHKETYHPEEIYLDLGELYLEKRQYSKAADALQRSIQLDPRDERAYYTLIKVYRRQGDRQAAAAAEQRFQYISRRHVQMQSLQARLFHAPTDATAHLHLARTYRDLDMAQQAMGQYVAYLRLQPGDAAATQELQQVAARLQATHTQNHDFAPQLPPLK